MSCPYQNNCNKLDLRHLICTAKFVVLAMFVSTLYSHVYLIGTPIFKVFFMFAYCIVTHREIKALCDKCDDINHLIYNSSDNYIVTLSHAWLIKKQAGKLFSPSPHPPTCVSATQFITWLGCETVKGGMWNRILNGVWNS